jgi:hypothetical protein
MVPPRGKPLYRIDKIKTKPGGSLEIHVQELGTEKQ